MDHSVPLVPLETTTNNIIRTTTTITTLSSISIPRALQSSIDNNEMIETIPIGEFSEEEEMTLAWTSRSAAIFSLVGGGYIFYWAWKRRDHVYHRLMLAVSIYLLLWSPWMIYGIAALPSDTLDIMGAHGNTSTCTAQGFFNQLSTAIPAYYVALSVFSWIVVAYGNFDPQQYGWIEKYIHIIANVWAIGSSTLLASIDAFNPSEGRPTCWIGSLPMGCGNDSGIECTRGPQNSSQILAIFVGLPVAFLLLLPTVTMMALALYLYRKNNKDASVNAKNEKRTTTTDTTRMDQEEEPSPPPVQKDEGSRNGSRNGSCRGSSRRSSDAANMNAITAWAVTKQSMVYLGTLYFIYTPALLMSCMGTLFGEHKPFVLKCIGNFVTVSQGFWYALVYRYFSSVSRDDGILAPAAASRQYSSNSFFRMSLCGERATADDMVEGDNKTAVSSRISSGPFRLSLRLSQVMNRPSTNNFQNSQGGHTTATSAISHQTSISSSAAATPTLYASKKRVKINNNLHKKPLSKISNDSTEEEEAEASNHTESIDQFTNSPLPLKFARPPLTSKRSEDSFDIFDESFTPSVKSKSSNRRYNDSSIKSHDDDSKGGHYSINIFDGSAANTQSQFSAFIYEGDSSDEEHDLEESRYWAGCQGS